MWHLYPAMPQQKCWECYFSICYWIFKKWKSDIERLNNFITGKDRLTTTHKDESSKSKKELLTMFNSSNFIYFILTIPVTLASGLLGPHTKHMATGKHVVDSVSIFPGKTNKQTNWIQSVSMNSTSATKSHGRSKYKAQSPPCVNLVSPRKVRHTCVRNSRRRKEHSSSTMIRRQTS